MRRIPFAIGAWARAFVLAGALAAGPAAAAQFETTAPTAILMHKDSGAVLFEKNADEAVAPASLVKLMTVEILFHRLATDRLKPDDEFAVSERAWREGGAASGGSTMFLPLNSKVKVEDLLRGIIVQSGNDATIVAAEGISGTQEAFVDLMNARAKELGLTGSTFRNPHGLDHPEQVVTMRDMAKLAAHIIRTYPEKYRIFSEEEFTFNDIRQRSRNPLLHAGIGDGLKTGYTTEAGYGLVASAERDGMRLILAMHRMKTPRERAEEARKVMSWGLHAFEEDKLFAAGETIAQAHVLGGADSTVPVAAAGPVSMVKPRGERKAETATRLDGPIWAPVRKGDRLGTLEVRVGETRAEYPLVAAADVAQGGIGARAWGSVAQYLTWDTVVGIYNWWREPGETATATK